MKTLIIKEKHGGIKTIINIKYQRKSQPTSMFIDKETCNDRKKNANKFNEFSWEQTTRKDI